MKPISNYIFVVLIVLAGLGSNLNAQDSNLGKVIYQRLTAYDFDVYQDDPRWQEYIKDLPKERRISYTLTFQGQNALYQEDSRQKEQLSGKLQNALLKANYAKTPKPEVRQIYYDLANQLKTEQIEFMTRKFLIDSELTPIPWKLTSKRKKVHDYICMGAEFKEGGDIITAWFTSEIPISAGPEIYYGLPGLILAVDRNEETFVLATAIDLSSSNVAVDKPEKGKKMSRLEFAQTVIKKTEEFKNAAAAKKRAAAGKGNFKKG